MPPAPLSIRPAPAQAGRAWQTLRIDANAAQPAHISIDKHLISGYNAAHDAALSTLPFLPLPIDRRRIPPYTLPARA